MALDYRVDDQLAGMLSAATTDEDRELWCGILNARAEWRRRCARRGRRVMIAMGVLSCVVLVGALVLAVRG